MAQALEKSNISPKLRKMDFLHKKRVIFSQNSDFDEILFSQKSLINRKNQPHTLPQQVLVQQTPIIFCCYCKPPVNFKKRPGQLGLNEKLFRDFTSPCQGSFQVVNHS